MVLRNRVTTVWAGRGDGQRLLSVGRWMSHIEAPRGTGQELVAYSSIEEASRRLAVREESATVEEGRRPVKCWRHVRRVVDHEGRTLWRDGDLY